MKYKYPSSQLPMSKTRTLRTKNRQKVPTSSSASECKKEGHSSILHASSKPLTVSVLIVSSNKKPPNQKKSSPKPSLTKIQSFYRNPINKK
jgi:hypothetical protein